MTTPLHATDKHLTTADLRYSWMSTKGWRPNKVQPGAVKVGTRWQPISGRVVVTPAGHIARFDDIHAVEAKGYPTRMAAVKAARRIVEIA